MKKTILFLTVFLFFGFVSAEEVQVYEDDNMILWGERWTEQESEPEPEPEVEETPEEEKEPEKAEEAEEAASVTENMECCCDVSSETEEKPKFFYVQPAIGFGTGLISGYRPTVSLNADFLVSHNEQINYYVGFDIDFKIAMRSYDMRLPIGLATKGNVVFDFVVIDDRELRSIGLWIELGLNLFFTYSRIGEFEFEETRHFSYGAAYGIGLDFVFKNYVILKVGLDWFLYYTYPDLIILVGYRF